MTGGKGGRSGSSRGGSSGTNTGGAMMPPATGGAPMPAGGAGGTMSDASGDTGLTDVVPPTDVEPPPPDAVVDMAPPVDTKPDVQPPKDMGSDLARNLANGNACVQGNQCTSGNCVDGFCCNSSCTNPCSACSMARTGQANGKCAMATALVGMKCGRGCQQFPGQNLLVVVDKICTEVGQCGFPQIPANPEYCTDNDPCTSNSCSEAVPNAARCVRVAKCTGSSCCCVTDGNNRACTTKTSCTGPGKMCM